MALGAVVDRIKHVHIRDCKGRQHGPGSPPLQANGRGDIDLLNYVRVLHERLRYTGALDLEIIGAKEYALPACVAIAAEARGHLQACLQPAVRARPASLPISHPLNYSPTAKLPSQKT